MELLKKNWEVTIAILAVLMVCISRIGMAPGQIVLVLTVLVSLIAGIKYRKEISITKEAKGYIKAYAVFVVSLLPSILFNGNIGAGIHDLLNIWLWRFVIFLVVVSLIGRRRILINMLMAFMIFFSFDCIASLVQSLTATSSSIRGVGFGGRVLGLAGIICMMLPISLIILASDQFESRIKNTSIFSIVSFIAGLLGNRSRGAWLTCLTMGSMVSLVSWKKSKKVFILIWLAIFATGIFVASQPVYRDRFVSITNTTTDKSNADRLWIWKSALDMYNDSPIIGIGVGQFKTKYDQHYKYEEETQNLPQSHNNMLQILSESGLVGMAGYIYFIGYCLIHSIQGWRRDNNPYDIMIFTTVLGFLVLFGQIEYTLGNSVDMRIFWFLMGILLSLKENKELVRSNIVGLDK